MTPAERLLAKLPDAKRAGNGWSARCPAHEDRRASLSIAEGDDGRALVCCHAGCSTPDIVAALGLTMADLMPVNSVSVSARAPSTSKTGRALIRPSPSSEKTTGRTFATAREAIAELERRHGPRSADWTFHDARGEPVGMVLRWALADGGKDIRPLARRADGWRIGAMPEPRPLFHLPDLPSAQRVYVCEGEKAADAAHSLGVTATTSSGGAQAAGKTDWGPLAGKDVIVWPDNDPPGERFAADVAGLVTAAGARSVRVVRLPDLPDGGDVVDWIDAHGDAAEPDAMRDALERLADAAPEWAPEATTEPGPVLTCLADVAPREVSWLWPGRIPLGRLTLLVGRPGEGKSFLTCDAASRVSTGTPWPDGGECPSGSVLLLTAEDDPADTIRPRLDAHRADVRRVHLLSAVRRVDADGEYERMVTLADVDAIEAALSWLPDCKLVVVDPVGSFLGGGTDAHRDNEVRGVLAPIARLAEKHGPAVLVVAHTRKAISTSADDTAMGSRAFTGIARAVWHLRRDPDNKGRRLFLPGKNNLAQEGDGLAFGIVGEPARIAWERDPVAMSADEAMAVEVARQKPGPDSEAQGAATTWLAAALADGPRFAKELFDEWINGQGGAKRTLERAKQALGVEAYRDAVPGPWRWRAKTANNTTTAPKSEELGDLGALGKTPGNLPGFEGEDSKTAKLFDLGALGDAINLRLLEAGTEDAA